MIDTLTALKTNDDVCFQVAGLFVFKKSRFFMSVVRHFVPLFDDEA